LWDRYGLWLLEYNPLDKNELDNIEFDKNEETSKGDFTPSPSATPCEEQAFSMAFAAAEPAVEPAKALAATSTKSKRRAKRSQQPREAYTSAVR